MIAAVERPGSVTATTWPGRLLLVQQAGAPLDSVFDLRSAAYERWLEAEHAARRRLDIVRSCLLASLEAAVPAASDRRTRRHLLDAKRNAYNGRALPDPPPDLDGQLRSDWHAYQAALLEQRRAFDEGRGTVVRDCSRRLVALLADERFDVACRYASPALAADLERHRASLAAEPLSRLGLGLAAYATKFITKANPFHLFGEVLVPHAPPRGPRYEIVLDLPMMMRIEARLVEHASARHVRMFLSPHMRHGDTDTFVISRPRGVRMASVRVACPAGDVVAFLDARTRGGATRGVRRAAWEVYCARLPSEQRSALRDAMARLRAAGIVSEYAIADWRQGASTLARPGDPPYRALAVLQGHHLRCRTLRELRRTHHRLVAAARALSESPATPYFVNAYSGHPTGEHERAAAALYDDLRELKPFFVDAHNYAAHAYVLTRFCAECACSGGGRIDYLEVVRRYARSYRAAAARYAPSAPRSAADLARTARWRTALRSLGGVLTRDEVHRLAACAPEARVRHVCFKGAFDYVRREYYVSNVYDGHGRFAGRYRLTRAPLPPLDAGSDACIDVELAVPHYTNLTCVARAFRTGTGFDRRYAAAFERWIDPSEIVVESAGPSIVYRHAPTGQPLRIHYRGFLLATRLPPEYQLLLAEHADVYPNPFLSLPAPVREDGPVHVPRLSYGSVCLRRDRWDVRVSPLDPLVRESDALRFGAMLRAWLHEHVRPGVDDWFYELIPDQGDAQRPLHLDLLNPFSALRFRRSILQLAGQGGVSFTMMEPPRTHLFAHRRARYWTELLIEV